MSRTKVLRRCSTLAAGGLLILALLGLSALPAAAAAPPSFAPQVPLATDDAPHSVAAADLNGDGRPDLVTANWFGDSVSVLFNTTAPGAAAPSFAAQVPFATNTNPSSVAVADLNSDGRPDLAAANWGNTVSVLLNTTVPGAAAPSFAAQSTFATGANPYSVAAADLNGDGRPDLITANNTASSVSVLLNTTAPGAAAPSFAAQVPFTTGAQPISVVAADLNGDGRPDLATVNWGSDFLSVLLNTTAPGAAVPSFAAQAGFSAGSWPHAVTAADLNGDGRPDLAAANWNSGTVSMLLNTAAPGATAPSFAAATHVAAGLQLYSIAAADLNADGRPDLAVTQRDSNALSVLHNTTPPGAAAPSFAAQVPLAAGTEPVSIAAADLNGDGKPDLAVANYVDDTISVLLNTTPMGAAPFTCTSPTDFSTGTNPYSVVAADLNGGGQPDLAAANAGSHTISALLNTTAPGAAAPAFAAQVSFGVDYVPTSVVATDLNRDGRPDLVTASYTDNTVSVLLNTTAPGAAAPSFADRVSFTTGVQPRSVAAADLNGDGKPDLAVANRGGNSVSVLLNATAPGAAAPAFASQVDLAAGNYPTSVVAADLNGDGRPDLVTTNYADANVSVLLNTTAPGAATPTFAAQVAFSTGTDPISVAAADLNGDGRPDLAVANWAGNSVSVLFNTTAPGAATPAFAAQAPFATGAGPMSVTAANLNGDGRPDLVTADKDGNTVSVLLNTTAPGAAAPSFAARVPSATGSQPYSVTAADLNGDGKPDLATANYGDNTISVLLNTTTAALALTKTVSPAIAYPGQPITYTMAFTNTNLFTATEVVITDTLPVNLNAITVTSSGVVITHTGAGPAYTWQVQDLAPGAGGVITLSGVPKDPLVSGVFTNTATIAGLGLEPRSAAAGITVVAPEVVVAPLSLTIPEPGGSAVFTVTLASRPAAAVAIPVSAANGECSAPAAVEIEPDQWQSGVAVTVWGAEDGPDGPQVCLVQLWLAVSRDSRYSGLDPDDVTVTVIDRYGVFLPAVIKTVR